MSRRSDSKRQGDDSLNDEQASRRPKVGQGSHSSSTPGKYGDLESFTVHKRLEQIRPGQVLDACPALKARHHSDVSFIFEHGCISDPQIAAMYDAWFEVRESTLLDEMHESYKKSRSKPIKPSTMKETLRALVTLGNMYTGSEQDSAVLREVLVLRLVYITMARVVGCTSGEIPVLEHYFPQHREDFDQILGQLQLPTIENAVQQRTSQVVGGLYACNSAHTLTGSQIVGGSGTGSGSHTIIGPYQPPVSQVSTCPGVSQELYEKIQAMRVQPGGSGGLSSIVGCAKGKQLIRGIIQATVDRPSLAAQGRMVKGVLLHGPPGTGKTTLIYAAARESSGLTVYLLSSAAVNDMYQGNSEKYIAAFYTAAAHNAPAIIFIDEIDALCAKRTADQSETRKSISSVLLTAMARCPPNVVTIGATSLPWNIDSAFLSRLKARIHVSLPSEEELKNVWELKLSRWPHSVSSDEFQKLSRKTYGFSGRDVEDAALQAQMNADSTLSKSPTHYRKIDHDGTEYLCECSAEDPAACPVMGDLESIARISGQPTSFKDLDVVVEDMLFCKEEAHVEEQNHVAWAKNARCG